jgi:hypothetical protein
MHDFNLTKKEAIKSYTTNMENINSKKNKEPKVLD